MVEKKNLKTTNVLTDEPENLRVKYSTLLAYINTVVTFRFTTLGFFLAGVALILGGTPSLGKYLLLTLITFSLYIIELRNRFLKNDLEVPAKLIEKEWGYVVNPNEDYKAAYTTCFNIVLPVKFFKSKNDITDNDIRENDNKEIWGILFGIIFLKPKITHSIAFDILYISVLVFAFYHVIRLIFHS